MVNYIAINQKNGKHVTIMQYSDIPGEHNEPSAFVVDEEGSIELVEIRHLKMKIYKKSFVYDKKMDCF